MKPPWPRKMLRARPVGLTSSQPAADAPNLKKRKGEKNWPCRGSEGNGPRSVPRRPASGRSSADRSLGPSARDNPTAPSPLPGHPVSRGSVPGARNLRGAGRGPRAGQGRGERPPPPDRTAGDAGAAGGEASGAQSSSRGWRPRGRGPHVGGAAEGRGLGRCTPAPVAARSPSPVPAVPPRGRASSCERVGTRCFCCLTARPF